MIRFNEEKKANEIALVEYFTSLNGEGHSAGMPTVFIRTLGCNLRCQFGCNFDSINPKLSGFCFGMDQKGNYPNLLKASNGSYLNLKDAKIGEEILTWDPVKKSPKVTKITNLFEREADDIHHLVLGQNGNDFNVTSNHPFYKDSNWVQVKDLVKGDKVTSINRGLIYKYLVEVVYKDTLINYSKKLLEDWELHLTEAKKEGIIQGLKTKGLENSFEKNYRVLSKLEKKDYPLENLFGSESLVVHHIDPDHHIDNPENLIIIPKWVHEKLHLRGYTFNKGKSPMEDYVFSNSLRRKNIKYGNKVINIETEDHTYFICPSSSYKNKHNKVNTFMKATYVHNCDTTESLCYENFKIMYPTKEPLWMTAQEIYNKVCELEKGWKHKSICLTGGEPLLEENKDFMIKELLPLFIEHHFDTSIETNGSIDYSEYKKTFGKARIVDGYGNREGLTIIADYKLPSSKMTKLMKKENFAIYDDTDLIKMVVSDAEEDWKELDNIIQAPTKAQIYISPMWGKVDTEKMWNYASNHPGRQVKVQLQLHKYFFRNPDQKGV